jgi:ABC-2 type transport system permease protein
MREIWLVFRREFLERVMARGFLIGTIIFPLFFGGAMFLPSLLEGGGSERTLVIVDETGAGLGQALAARLGREPAEEDANRYTLEVLEGPVEARQVELNARVVADEIDGYLVVPADVFTGNELHYRSTTIGSMGMLQDIQIAAAESVRGERLRLAGVDLATVADLIRPVSVQNVRIGVAGEERGDAISNMVFAYILAFVIYFMVFFYGVHVMRSVLEEKTSRIAEVLVSSLRASHLMAGKILGVAGAALLQVAIWGALIALLITQSDRIGERMGLEGESFSAIAIEPATLVLLLAFFLLGFFLFASLFAALGAAVTNEQEAQSFQMVLLLPLMMPLLFLGPLTTEPLGRAATFLGLFPLTAPVAMPMRLASASIPAAQIALSLALLLLALVAMSWLAGKIYRIGILATGQRPGVKELIRWMRMA